MRYLKKLLFAGLIGVSSLFGLSGCSGQRTQETEFIDVMQKKKGATLEEAQACFPYAFRKEHGKTAEKDGKTVCVPNYDSVTLEDRIAVTQQMKEDLDSLLGFKDVQNTQMIDQLGMRDALEQRRAAVEYNLARLELANLFNHFKAAMIGYTDQETVRAHGGALSTAISESDLVFPDGSLERKIRFEAPYVDGARRSGQLKIVETFELKNMVYVSEPNPDYPLKDPTKATRWVQKAFGLRIIGYDIGENGSKKPKYVEVYRLTPSGEQEAQPAIKVFHPLDREDLCVAVMDSERFGIVGHGKYDRLERINIDSGKELIKYHEGILHSIFGGGTRRRERPEEAPMRVEMVRVGDLDLSEGLWEYNKDGWEVPILYKLPPRGDNYQLVVCFKSSKGRASPAEGSALPPAALKEVKYIAREYQNPGSSGSSVEGRVVEFYRVKDQYRNVINMEIDERRIVIDMPDGRTETMLESRVLEPVPYMKAFDQGDASRFEIWDKDGKDAPRYELRREYTPKPAELDLDTDKDGKK